MNIATRQSPLALWQSEHVADLLKDKLSVSLLPLTTRGDQWLDRPLAAVGGKGLFLKELEQALLDDRADIAVHSMKDMPAEMDPRLTIGAILPRANPWDGWVSNDYPSIADLPMGATVGTSSPRRQLQILQLRPDLKILPVRGNVQTRLSKLDEGHCQGLLLACAGLERLELNHRITEVLKLPTWIPAAAQGAIAIQCRTGDETVLSLLEDLHCDSTAFLVSVERMVAAALEADCHAALAVYAEPQEDGQLHLHGLYGADPAEADTQPAPMVRISKVGYWESAESLAMELAEGLQQALNEHPGHIK